MCAYLHAHVTHTCLCYVYYVAAYVIRTMRQPTYYYIITCLAIYNTANRVPPDLVKFANFCSYSRRSCTKHVDALFFRMHSIIYVLNEI